MSKLWSSDDPSVWLAEYSSLDDKSPSLASIYKSRIQQLNKSNLLELNNWINEELPSIVKSRSPFHLLKNELNQLMKWKLLHGQYRPRLQQLIESNSETSIIDCTKRAYTIAQQTSNNQEQYLSIVKSAIKILCELNGVGPATASAVLSIIEPNQFPFMGDEAMNSIPKLKPIKYTIEHYLLFVQEIRKKVQLLQKNSLDNDNKQFWTANRCVQCLWSEKHSQTLTKKVKRTNSSDDETTARKKTRK
ncbi:unnamed protein product [Didymodactylos carnosus]|uniref:Uncharacterized protein n=1 Tax=Didymodactylos carnosus TaxID=1234261 RepID=A0A8S2E321_9BILA|nr:unnamed protein product [Didymodactylos carnosus]CAF3875457.1 unnamed protein product [Didymodactylos carnosus]